MPVVQVAHHAAHDFVTVGAECQPRSWNTLTLETVESRFFSSVMLMVRIVLAFRCRFVLAYIYHYTG